MRLRGTVFSTVTSCTIGACSAPSSRESSGLLGSVARSVTSAGLIARPWTTAALIASVRRGLRERHQGLGERDRVGLRVGDRGRSLEYFSSGSNGVPLRARLASGVRTALDLALAVEAAAELGDLRDIQPLVVHKDREVRRLERRFELSGFLGGFNPALVTAISCLSVEARVWRPNPGPPSVSDP